MSIREVTVPELSESVSEATLIAWKKKVGDAVAADEILVEIETDKIVLEVPAPVSGTISAILAGDGATVTSNAVIATITEGAAQAAPQAEPEVRREAGEPAAAAVSAPSAAPLMPAAEKLIANSGIDAQNIAGSGLGGRITKGDVLSAMAHPQSAPAAVQSRPQPQIQTQAPAPAAVSPQTEPVRMDPAGRIEQRVPMSRLRARVAERLLQSQQQAAILTTFNEVNLANVIALRNRYKPDFEKKYGIKLGFMSFFVKACCAALKAYPILNASVDGTDIIYHGYIDIGIAVGSPRGLVVPVLRDADQMSFAEIETAIADFGRRAKDGKLTLEELSGGTFTISNGGVFGSMLSTPIINPPQSAILGIHATKERPVVENGQIVIRPMNYFALSYDHRIIDGREAVLGLVEIKNALEDPARLLLEI
jgi:2-oxoglutarate dehydrogenase E2 component (dihydrolipoamide succinyltransferase)